MAKEGELWHLVEAKREDGSPTIFRIRELDRRLDQTRIFVTELPYPCADGSRLPDAPSYRRFATFEEQWLDPACSALDWTAVAVKIEDGSFFVYLYGSGDPIQLVERLSPFDGALGFFDEADPAWDEYAALRELLEEAKTIPLRPDDEQPIPQAIPDDELLSAVEHTRTTTPIRRADTVSTSGSKSRAKSKAKAKAKAKAKPTAKAKPQAKSAANRASRTKSAANRASKANSAAKPKASATAKSKRPR